VFTFCAPKSFGKTIAGFACTNEATVICTSSNTLKVWIGELKENLTEWYNSKPSLSKVLICNPVNSKNHWEYLKNVPNDRKSLIILVTDKHLEFAMQTICSVPLLSKNKKILVIDEAHYYRKYIHRAFISKSYDKCLLLSATPIDPKIIRIPDNQKVRRIHVDGLGRVPEVIWHFSKCKPEEEEEVILKICEKHKKTAIIGTMNYITHIHKTTIDDRKIYFQKNGVGTIPKFNEDKNPSVLLLNSNQNEGINVYANALIISNTSGMNTDRYSQSIGRIVRTGNTEKYVHVYMICNNTFDLYRSIYAKCYYLVKWPFIYDTLPDEKYLQKSMQLAKILRISPEKLMPADGCIFFHNPETNKCTVNDILKWWIENIKNKKIKTQLDEELIIDLLTPCYP
jgi:hypothetical protein